MGEDTLFGLIGMPNMDLFANFKAFIASFGLKLFAGNEGYKPMVFQKLLDQIKDTEYSKPISKIMLRSMQKARYETENLGHFGLALKDYCHFTSPIRRYPDLTIHRIITEMLEGNLSIKRKKELEEIRTINRTLIFYEAPHRLMEMINDLYSVFGNRNISISREITKKFESVYRGNIENFLKSENIIRCNGRR